MELFIILISFVAASCGAFVRRGSVVMECASLVATGIAGIGALLMAMRVASQGTYAFGGFFSVDALGAIILLIIGCVGFAVTVYSVPYLREEVSRSIIGYRRVRQYYVFLNLFLAAMVVAVSSGNPILTWISIEATTLSTAFLISFYNKPGAMEAAWKYLIINSVGLLLGFFGTILYYSVSGESGLATWESLLSSAEMLDPTIAKIAFIVVLIGYGTKVGLVPMHTWLPDAHSKAPVPISALLSGVLLNVALLSILRFKLITDATVGVEFSRDLLVAFGTLSILIASLIIFAQKNYKRLLAYSSIENMGILVIGFAFGGIGVFAAILHMMYHSLFKSALFLLSGNIFLRYESTKIKKISGVMLALPMTSVIFFAGFFAITGAPPFGIFLTKFYIFSVGMTQFPILFLIAIIFVALVFVGFLRHVVSMLFGEKSAEIFSKKENPWLLVSPVALVVVALYLSFSFPTFLETLINVAVTHYSL